MKNIYDQSEDAFILGFDIDETALLDSALDWDKNRRPINYMNSDDLVEEQAFDAMEDLKNILSEPTKKTLRFHASKRVIDTLTDIIYTYSSTNEAADLEYRELAITMAGEILSTQVAVELFVECNNSSTIQSVGFVDQKKFKPQEIDDIVAQTDIPNDLSALSI